MFSNLFLLIFSFFSYVLTFVANNRMLLPFLQWIPQPWIHITIHPSSDIQPWTTWNNNWLTPATGLLLCLGRQPDEWIYLCATTEYWMMWNGMVWYGWTNPNSAGLPRCFGICTLFGLDVKTFAVDGTTSTWNYQLHNLKQNKNLHITNTANNSWNCNVMRCDEMPFAFLPLLLQLQLWLLHHYFQFLLRNSVWNSSIYIYNIQTNEMRNSQKEIGTFNENGVRNFVATKDTSRDFSNSQDNTDRGSMSDQAFAYSASSVESLPSASGSSKYSYYCSISCLLFLLLLLLLLLLFLVPGIYMQMLYPSCSMCILGLLTKHIISLVYYPKTQS